MCTACTISFDQTKADAFAGKFVQHLNGAAIAMMVSLGHRTGLFDVLGEGEAFTSQSLAAKANLSERYVREWLGAMVTGDIVAYDPETQTYHLPAEHAAFLTRAASPNNMAVPAQFISVLGGVEDLVADAFRHGKGVPYSAYPRFHIAMAEESQQTVIAGLDEHILPLVEGIQRALENGIEVADIGCGSGLALLQLAEQYPNSRFTGLDLSDEATAAARQLAKTRELPNIRFEACDLTHWTARRQFDLITAFDAIHDQAHPDKVLANIRRALKPGGVFLMQDIKASSHVDQNRAQPLAPFIYTISTMHCMSVSLAQGGVGLGAAWGKELAVRMLGEAGFGDVQVKELAHDFMNYYYVVR